MKSHQTLMAALAAWPLLNHRYTPLPQTSGREGHIVLLRPQASLKHCIEYCTSCGASDVQPLCLVNGFACTCTNAQRAEIRCHPTVRLVEPNAMAHVNALARQRPAWQAIPWGVSRVGAPQAWPSTKGQGVRMAVIDTGVDPEHPNLKPNLAGGVNVADPAQSYADDNGHGTHVAGTIAAADTGQGVVGVAPEARLFAVKAFDATGSGRLSDVVLALEWCLENGMDVVNMSFGSTRNSVAVAEAVQRAANHMVLVAAAGNTGRRDSVEYPARYPEVLAVSASTRRDKLAHFSSRGPEVDLIAPGQRILSTYLGGGYRELSGTSMAAPHVTGVAALLLARHPRLSPGSVAQLLLETAEPLPRLNTDQQGAGLVSAIRAVVGR